MVLSQARAKAQLIALDRYEAKQSLLNFIPLAWPELEPAQEYVPSKQVEAVCDHLEAVTYGWINRLLINVPPGSMKSLLSSVMWPSWEWGPRDMGAMRYLATAFNDGPVKRDTRKMRDLIMSPWYQDRWPKIKLVRAGETSFANSQTGAREGVPFPSLTSQRGDRLIIDDPHSTTTAESDTERKRTVRQFREGAVNRLNNQEKSAIVVIMQRLHEGDISGEILANEMGYTHLCLPMEYEPVPYKIGGHTFDPKQPNEIGFTDWRTDAGQLLNPTRFTPKAVADLKRDMGEYAFTGQYQQRPVPREGGLFKREWFVDRIIGAAPPGTVWVRHWDLAGTKNGGAYTAGIKLGKTPDGRYVVGHAWRFQEEGKVVRERIKLQGDLDGRDVLISLPQDGGQAGKVQKSEMVAYLAGFRVAVILEASLGDKQRRAEPFSVQCEAGNVSIVKGDWNEAYLDELCVAEGTAITTLRGQVPVQHVTCDDFVLTRKGWRRVTVSRCTNEAAEVCELTSKKGITLRVTRSHPIFQPGYGFKEAGLLKIGDALLRCTAVLSFACTPIPSFTLVERSPVFTLNYTVTSTWRKLVQFRKATTYTIRMKIQPIMKSLILSAYPTLSTCNDTPCGMHLDASIKQSAWFAEQNTRQRKNAGLRLVQSYVKTNTNGRKETFSSTSATAQSAKRLLQQVENQLRTVRSAVLRYITGEKSRNKFQLDAVANVCAVAGKHRVYNLEVDGVHEYVANGLLVHNCLFPGSKYKDQVDATSGAFSHHALGPAQPLFGSQTGR